MLGVFNTRFSIFPGGFDQSVKDSCADSVTRVYLTDMGVSKAKAVGYGKQFLSAQELAVSFLPFDKCRTEFGCG